MTRAASALLFGALLGLMLRPAPAAARAVARFAIVIGNNQAESEGEAIEPLRYADDDAVTMHELLLEAGVVSQLFTRMDRDTQALHPQVRATGAPRVHLLEAALEAVFAQMRAAAAGGAKPELIILYSGHGDVVAGEGYIVLEDARLTRSDLRGWLTRSPAAQNHVFIDACRSFFMLHARRPGGRRLAHGAALLSDDEEQALPNVGFVLSTSSDRESHEWDALQGGILTHELRSALRGGADADLDGGVDYAELGVFLSRANEKVLNPNLRPDFKIYPPRGDFQLEVLTWPSAARAVRAEVGAVGHVYVENAHGTRILDFHPAAQQATILHLPRERPLFVCEQGGDREYALRAEEPVFAEQLDRPSRPQVRNKGTSPTSIAMDELFAAPFDLSAVTRFASWQQTAFAAAASARSDHARRARLRQVAAVTAISASAAALALGSVALQRYLAGDGAAQAELVQLNRDVRTLRAAALASGSLALAAAAAWSWLRWHAAPGRDSSPQLVFEDDPRSQGLGRSLQVELGGDPARAQ